MTREEKALEVAFYVAEQANRAAKHAKDQVWQAASRIVKRLPGIISVETLEPELRRVMGEQRTVQIPDGDATQKRGSNKAPLAKVSKD